MFSDDTPSVGEIGQIGYFKGRQRRWLFDERDLIAMYDNSRDLPSIFRFGVTEW